VYGYDREQLVRNGRVVARAITLSHAEQHAFLAASCPEAAPVAVVVGDPWYDQITDWMARRETLRHAMGVDETRPLVVVSTTWGRGSLWGRQPEIFTRLLSSLPPDRYRMVGVLHPNIEAFHGRYQVRRLLDECCQRGLTLVEPTAGWQQALAAADWVIGDHGSVTLYATLTGAPILLAAFGDDDVDPRSPIADLGLTAPRLHLDDDIERQLLAAKDAYQAQRHTAIARRITSAPGAFARNMSELLYSLLGPGAPTPRL
jgi:hypothetical protein